MEQANINESLINQAVEAGMRWHEACVLTSDRLREFLNRKQNESQRQQNELPVLQQQQQEYETRQTTTTPTQSTLTQETLRVWDATQPYLSQPVYYVQQQPQIIQHMYSTPANFVTTLKTRFDEQERMLLYNPRVFNLLQKQPVIAHTTELIRQLQENEIVPKVRSEYFDEDDLHALQQQGFVRGGNPQTTNSPQNGNALILLYSHLRTLVQALDEIILSRQQDLSKENLNPTLSAYFEAKERLLQQLRNLEAEKAKFVYESILSGMIQNQMFDEARTILQRFESMSVRSK